MKFIGILVLQILATEALEPRSVNLDIETVLRFDHQDRTGDLKFIEDVQNFLGKVKDVIDPKKEHASRRSLTQPKTVKTMKFTDFLKQFLYALKKYKNDDLEDALAILQDEMRKYHYKGCKFYEVIQDNDIRRFVGNKLSSIHEMDGYSIKKGINKVLRDLETAQFDHRQNEILAYINSLYRHDSTNKLESVLQEVEAYGQKSKRSNLNLVQIMKNALRTVIFDHYSNLKTNVRNDLKIKIQAFWKYINKQNNDSPHIETTRYHIFQDIPVKVDEENQFDKPIAKLLPTDQPLTNKLTKSKDNVKKVIKDVVEQIFTADKKNGKKTQKQIYYEEEHEIKRHKKGKNIKNHPDVTTNEKQESKENVEITAKTKKHKRSKKYKSKHKKLNTNADYSKDIEHLKTEKDKEEHTEHSIYARKTKPDLAQIYKSIYPKHNNMETRKAYKVSYKPMERKRKPSITVAEVSTEETTKKSKRKKKHHMRSNKVKTNNNYYHQSHNNYDDKSSLENEGLKIDNISTKRPKKHKSKRKAYKQAAKHSEEGLSLIMDEDNNYTDKKSKSYHIYRRIENFEKQLNNLKNKNHTQNELTTKTKSTTVTIATTTLPTTKTYITAQKKTEKPNIEIETTDSTPKKVKDIRNDVNKRAHNEEYYYDDDVIPISQKNKTPTKVDIKTTASIPTNHITTQKQTEKTNLEIETTDTKEKYKDIKKDFNKDAYNEADYYDDNVTPISQKIRTPTNKDIKFTEKSVKKDVKNVSISVKKAVSEDYYYDDVTPPMAPEMKTTIITTKTVTETTQKTTKETKKTEAPKTEDIENTISKENSTDIFTNKGTVNDSNEFNDNYNFISNNDDKEFNNLKKRFKVSKSKTTEESSLKLSEIPFLQRAKLEEPNLPKASTSNKLKEPKLSELPKIIKPNQDDSDLALEPNFRAESTLSGPTLLNQPIINTESNISKIQLTDKAIFRTEPDNQPLKDESLLNLPTLPSDPNFWNKPMLQYDNLPKLPDEPQLPHDPLSNDSLFGAPHYPSENLPSDTILKNPLPNFSNLPGEPLPIDQFLPKPGNLPEEPNLPVSPSLSSDPYLPPMLKSGKSIPYLPEKPNLPSESIPNEPLLPPYYNFKMPMENIENDKLLKGRNDK